MVQSKADREKQKLITDKCQGLIEVLLKEEDNKYCVDCDAKGPRWASWNLGIFLCIRCAGIHRNLGVHISRVKSVNLDAWTPEHVAYVQRMGNSRARAIYEANLPDDFRRPQTDTALESFIRAKYEHKKYIALDYVDPGPPEPAFNVDEEIKRLKEQKKSKLNLGSNRTIIQDSFTSPNAGSTPPTSHTSSRVTLGSASANTNQASKSRSTVSNLDILSQPQQQPQLFHDNSQGSDSGNKPKPANKSALADLMDLDLGFGATPASNIDTFNLTGSSNNSLNNNLTFNFGQSLAPASQPQPQQTNPASLADFGSLMSTASTLPASIGSSLLTPNVLDGSKIRPPTSSTDGLSNNLTMSNNSKNVFDLLDL